jgi:hypothetical protein
MENNNRYNLWQENCGGKLLQKGINRKLRVATVGFSQVTGQLKSCKMIIYHQHEISDRWNTIMPYI